jgi:hypothetical protein
MGFTPCVALALAELPPQEANAPVSIIRTRAIDKILKVSLIAFKKRQPILILAYPGEIIKREIKREEARLTFNFTD